jgi:flagellar basal-body rod protein FlgB
MRVGNLVNTNLLERALDASVMRDEAINQNIANIDTPNYKRKKVLFEEYLRDSDMSGIKGKRTDPRHIPIGDSDAQDLMPKMLEDSSQNKMRLDGNNVDINTEMSDLSKNIIKNSALVQRISGRFRSMNTVLRDGR